MRDQPLEERKMALKMQLNRSKAAAFRVATKSV